MPATPFNRPEEGWLALAAQDRRTKRNGGAGRPSVVARKRQPQSHNRRTGVQRIDGVPERDGILHLKILHSVMFATRMTRIRRGEYAEAEARYRAALTTDSYHLHGLLGLAAVYMKVTDRHEEARCAIPTRSVSAPGQRGGGQPPDRDD